MYVRRRLTISLFLAASLLLASAAPAQNGTAATGDWSAVKAISAGSKLSVKLKSGRTIEGRLAGVTDDALSLSVKSKPAELKREDVRSVYRLTGKSATKATLIGLGVGAGAGLALGAAADSSSDGFEGIDAAVTAGLTVLGAGAGALTGYLLGRRGGKRVLVYQAAQQ